MIEINLKVGNDKEFSLTFNDANSNPINLTLYENLYGHISASPNLATETLKLSLGNGLSILDTNKLIVTIPAASTFNFISDTYWMDIKFLDNLKIKDLATVKFKINQTTTSNG